MIRENCLIRKAARKRAEARLPVVFTTVQVTRDERPMAVRCRWGNCYVFVEWVQDLNGGLLPMIDPMRYIAVTEVNDLVLYTIDVKDCHLSNCVEAPGFVRKLWGGF